MREAAKGTVGMVAYTCTVRVQVCCGIVCGFEGVFFVTFGLRRFKSMT